MPRKRTAVRKNGNHTKDQMKMALSFIGAGTSIRKAAKAVGISHNTVRRYFQKIKNCESPNDVRLTPNYANRIIFTEEEEEFLKSHIKYCGEIFYGLTYFDCRKLAFQFAILKKKPSLREAWYTNSMAGLDWLRGFRKRHPDIILKKHVPSSVVRTTLLDKHLVETYFDKLYNVLESFSDSTRIYNLDEFVTTIDQHSQPQKLSALAPQNETNISKAISEDKEESITTCCIVSATGQVLPPVIVFPKKTFESPMLHGAPPGCLGLATPSGTMKPDLFLDVMRHFIESSNSSITNPSLLIIDNDESHLALEALELAKNAGVKILSCPPHSMSKLQPLEVGVFGAYKEFYMDAMDSFTLRYPGQKFTVYNVGQIIGHAFTTALTPALIINAFKITGIVPFDRNFLPEDIFLKPFFNQQNPPQAKSSEKNIDESTKEVQNWNCSLNIAQGLRTASFDLEKGQDEYSSQNFVQPISMAKDQNHPAELVSTEKDENFDDFLDVDATTEQSLYSSYNDSNTMQSDSEIQNSGTRIFKSLTIEPVETNICNETGAKSINSSEIDMKFEADYSLLKEEVDDIDSVSDISAVPHLENWKTETESQPPYDFNDDEDEQYENKSLNDLKRIALISQTKMLKAQEAAARAKEKLSLYKLEILKRTNGDIFQS